MNRPRQIRMVLLLGVLLGMSSQVLSSSQDKANLAEMKKNIGLFESVLNQSLAQAFGGPFETLDRARGAYLPGYGVVFSFEISLTPLQNLGPFTSAPTAKEEQALRTEEVHRREKVINVAEQVLGDFSQTLNPLTPGESVAIVIHTVAAHPGKIERSTIVLSAEKKLLDARESKTISQANFVQKLTKTEY